MSAKPARETVTISVRVDDEDSHDLDGLVPIRPDLDAGVALTNGAPVLLVQVRGVAGVSVVDLTTIATRCAAALLSKDLRP